MGEGVGRYVGVGSLFWGLVGGLVFRSTYTLHSVDGSPEPMDQGLLMEFATQGRRCMRHGL